MTKAITAALLTMAIFVLGTSNGIAQQPAYQPGEVLVRYKAGTDADTVSRSTSAMGGRALQTFDQGRMRHLALPDDLSVEDAVAAFQADPDVEFAEPNYLLYPQTLPDDPYFDQQWGLNNSGQSVSGVTGTAGADIDAVRAWELMTGSGAMVVAVVDTGSNINHPDLSARAWTNPGEIADNGIDDDGNGYVDDIHGWDFADGDNDPQDASGHGTHVAGIIAAQNNNGLGVAGAGPGVRIMPLRFMTAFDTGTVSNAIHAIEYAVAQGARVINCSWGSSGYSASLYGIIASSDALFVCAAGNNGTDNDADGFYPASYNLQNIISVAAADQSDDLAWFSNYGASRVHVAAPGFRIYSLGLDRQTLWAESFSDNEMTGWRTGGTSDEWSIGASPYSSEASVLRVTAQSAYSDGADAWAMAPALDLSAASATKLTFQLVGASEDNKDYLYVEVSTDDGVSWTNRPVKVSGSILYNGISGSYAYWTTAALDLGPYDGRSQLLLRFRFKSNAENSDTGFFIDNLLVSAPSADETYQFMSGTSMAAGFVSGVAAWLLSENGSLTTQALRSILVDGVDLKDSFTDTTTSGGRLNAYNSLMLLNDPDYQVPTATASGGTDGGGGGCFISSTMR